MQIPVRCSCGTCAEWALIEFQGEVGRTNDDSLDGLSVGSLCVTAPETLQLTIGHHRVEGKQVQLKKPLAILRKSPASGPDGVAYDVVGVIRSKVHFKTRPLALISAPEAGKKRAKVDGASDFFKARGRAAAAAEQRDDAGAA